MNNNKESGADTSTAIADALLNALPYPVLNTTATMRIRFDVSHLSDKELDEIPDTGADFQQLDKENRILTLVVSVEDEGGFDFIQESISE